MKRGLSVFAGVAVCCVFAINISLLKVNAGLRNQLKALQHTDGPAIGQSISSLRGTDIQNQPLQISTSGRGRKTVLFLYTPTCPFCKANWPNWKRLTDEFDATTDLVWGDLSGSATGSYLNEHGIKNASAIRVGPESRDIDAFHVTPTTVLLGPDGKVQDVWLGRLTPENVADIRGHLK